MKRASIRSSTENQNGPLLKIKRDHSLCLWMERGPVLARLFDRDEALGRGPVMPVCRTPRFSSSPGRVRFESYVERQQHGYDRGERRARFPRLTFGRDYRDASRPSAKTLCHALSAHHVANRFSDKDRISRRQGIIQIFGDRTGIIADIWQHRKRGHWVLVFLSAYSSFAFSSNRAHVHLRW